MWSFSFVAWLGLIYRQILTLSSASGKIFPTLFRQQPGRAILGAVNEPQTPQFCVHQLLLCHCLSLQSQAHSDDLMPLLQPLADARAGGHRLQSAWPPLAGAMVKP